MELRSTSRPAVDQTEEGSEAPVQAALRRCYCLKKFQLKLCFLLLCFLLLCSSSSAPLRACPAFHDLLCRRRCWSAESSSSADASSSSLLSIANA